MLHRTTAVLVARNSDDVHTKCKQHCQPVCLVKILVAVYCPEGLQLHSQHVCIEVGRFISETLFNETHHWQYQAF